MQVSRLVVGTILIASLMLPHLSWANEAGQDGKQLADRPVRTQGLLQRFYDGAGDTRLWTDAKLTRQALDILQAADQHGLVPADYRVRQPGDGEGARFDRELTGALLQFLADLHFGRVAPGFATLPDDMPRSSYDPVEHLRQALRTGRLDQAVAQAQPPIPLYLRVKHTLAQYRQLELRSKPLPTLPPPPPDVKLRPGMHYAGAPQLRERLVLLGDLTGSGGAADSTLYSPELAAAVKRFQLRHGLEEDGILGRATMAALAVPLSQRVRQLELTMERLRWIPPLRPGPVVVVNVPAFRLWAFDTTQTAEPLEMRVIVGTAARTPTPLFIGQMRHLEFNPYWNVPRSIELGEIVPKLVRDPDYLRKNDMELVARDGNPQVVAADAPLAALRAGTVRVRQRPGARNVLGAVKFAMPNPMNIYLHSTSARELFNKARRDLSHGCIRLERPAELAQFVLRDDARWDQDSILAAMAPGPTKTVRLRAPIPVILSYATAMTDRSGRALFAQDIYGLDLKLAQDLGLR